MMIFHHIKHTLTNNLKCSDLISLIEEMNYQKHKIVSNFLPIAIRAVITTNCNGVVRV